MAVAPPAVRPPWALGIDLGTSGLRLALLDGAGEIQVSLAAPYPQDFSNPIGWCEGLEALCHQLTDGQRAPVGALAVAGTSGTLLLCRGDGSLAASESPLSRALPYHQACLAEADQAADLVGGQGPAASASGSLARALALLHLLASDGGPPTGSGWLLRHQADWLMGWLLGDWAWGEEGNNLRLGWDLVLGAWAGDLASAPWAPCLPRICRSGSPLGRLDPGVARRLGLPPTCRVVAGSTDANAAVLAANPQPGDGVAVLGTTLVLKQFSPYPLKAPGISCHRLAGRWLVGGASNAGAGILRRFFSDDQLVELSRQINPHRASGLVLRPLPARGERFPVDDPNLEPVLGPRPVSDALYLQALLEGLTAVEQAGWQRLQALGCPPVERVISLGGGARNPQWRTLRQRVLGVPVLNRPGLVPAVGMAHLAMQALGRSGQDGDTPGPAAIPQP